jgi:hypothetical protein
MPIGVIYRALKTITAANRRVNPELRRVVVINHSICDVYAPFVRRASPWATLLDYFSHEHNLLFVVSAGNIFSKFPVVEFPNIAAYEDADETTREAAVLGSIEMSKATRTILSPAESVNALTIGAVHADHAEPDHTAPPDPYPTFSMTNLASAVGLGVNRSVKPDFLEAGGRFAAGMTNVRGGSLEVHARPSIHYGQQVAAPSITGQVTRRRLTSGTSNAAALELAVPGLPGRRAVPCEPTRGHTSGARMAVAVLEQRRAQTLALAGEIDSEGLALPEALAVPPVPSHSSQDKRPKKRARRRSAANPTVDIQVSRTADVGSSSQCGCRSGDHHSLQYVPAIHDDVLLFFQSAFVRKQCA